VTLSGAWSLLLELLDLALCLRELLDGAVFLPELFVLATLERLAREALERVLPGVVDDDDDDDEEEEEEEEEDVDDDDDDDDEVCIAFLK
jgi:hypothetical protein